MCIEMYERKKKMVFDDIRHVATAHTEQNTVSGKIVSHACIYSDAPNERLWSNESCSKQPFLRCACHQHQCELFYFFLFFYYYSLENALIHFSFHFLIYYLTMRIAILKSTFWFYLRDKWRNKKKNEKKETKNWVTTRTFRNSNVIAIERSIKVTIPLVRER